MTPFARRALDRGLTALMVSEARHTRADWNPKAAAQTVPVNQTRLRPDRRVAAPPGRAHRQARGRGRGRPAGRRPVATSGRSSRRPPASPSPTPEAAAMPSTCCSRPSRARGPTSPRPNSLREVEVGANLLLRDDDPSDDPTADYPDPPATESTPRRTVAPRPREDADPIDADVDPRRGRALTTSGTLRRPDARRHHPPQPGDPLLRRRLPHRPPQPERHGRWARPLGHHPPGGHHRGPPARCRASPARPPGRDRCWPCPSSRRPRTTPTTSGRAIGVPVTVFPRWLRCTRLQPALPGGLRGVEARPQPAPDRPDPLHPPQLRQGPPAAAGRARPLRRRLHQRPPRRLPVGALRPRRRAHLRQPDPPGQRHRLRRPGHRPAGQVPAPATPSRPWPRRSAPPPQTIMPQCRGRHPHLGLASEPCTEQLRTLVLGASNLWFNASVSVLSLPGGRWIARPARLRQLGCVRQDAGQGGPRLRPGLGPDAAGGVRRARPRRGLGRRRGPPGRRASRYRAPTCSGRSGPRSPADRAASPRRTSRPSRSPPRRSSSTGSPASRSPTACGW